MGEQDSGGGGRGRGVPLASPVRRVGVNPRWGIPNTLTVNDLKLLQLSHQVGQG